MILDKGSVPGPDWRVGIAGAPVEVPGVEAFGAGVLVLFAAPLTQWIV